MISFLNTNKTFTLALMLLIFLLWRNPLSSNNFISELEPSPDSMHYLNPLVSLKMGKGLVISYQDRAIPTNVPPFYSLILFPIFSVLGDIRFFYLTNVLLAILSTYFFYKIITKLLVNDDIKTILLFGFVTNFVIYWYPQVAMAENLLIPLNLLSIWLLLQPLGIVSTILLSSLAVAFFATKYVAWVLSLSLILVFIIKTTSARTSFNRKISYLSLFFLNLLILFLIYSYSEYLNKGVNIFNTVVLNLQNVANVFLSFINKPEFQIVGHNTSTNGAFSKYHMAGNFIRYLAGIMGGYVTVLGKDFILLPAIIGMTSTIAIFINLFVRKSKLISLYFFLSIISTLYFISTFYIVDARYLFVFIPNFLLIFGLFSQSLINLLKRFYKGLSLKFMLGFIYLAIILSMLPLQISQILTNIKGNFPQLEKVNNYEAINAMNKYTSTLSSRPVIITTLSPFMVDFYSNKNYELLPLSYRQHFMDRVNQVWGIALKDSLTDLYKQYLKQNRSVLVSIYQTDLIWFESDMNKIREQFNLLLIEKGCNNNCNLYKLEIK